MPIPTIEQVRQIGDFSTLYHWELRFAKFPAVGSYPQDQDLNLRCESVELPQSSGSSINVTIRGQTVKQPGIYTPVGSLSLTFVETVNSVISEFIRQWRNACFDVQSGVSQSKADVEATIVIVRMNRQGEPVWAYTLIGAFLEDAQLGSLDGSSPDAMRPAVILSYDYFVDGKVGS
jgi:hypothetical protein